MTILRTAALAAMISAQALAAIAESREDQFFHDLDSDRNGVVDREEFDVNKGAILYSLDKNRSLTIEQAETKLAPQQFSRYAGDDGVIDGLELFDMPGTRFEAFDQDGDQQISAPELRRQLASLRAGPQTAEGK